MRHREYVSHPACPAEACLEVIGGKWKGVILASLAAGPKRFGELGRLLPDITEKTLGTQLRELEAAGVVTRTVYAQVPPRVDYALTESGRELQPIIALMRVWGERYLQQQAVVRS